MKRLRCWLFLRLTQPVVSIQTALTDDSISDEEYSPILLEFETFTRMKEDLRIKSKTNLEKTGNIETEASVLFHRNTSTT